MVMKQKNGKRPTIKIIGLAGLSLALMAGSASILSDKGKKPLIYVKGHIKNSDSLVTLMQPSDSSFNITNSMLLLHRIEDKDTILSLAKLSHQTDSTVFKVDTMINIKVSLK